MKRLIRRATILLLAVAMVLGAGVVPAVAGSGAAGGGKAGAPQDFDTSVWEDFIANPPAPPVAVVLEGQMLAVDVPAQIIGGSTMLPMRAIFEELGAEVDWDQDTRTVTATTDDTTIVLPIGSTSPTVNGEAITIPQAAVTVEGRTLVPVRFVSEALGMDVNWDGDTRTAYIGDAPEYVTIEGTRIRTNPSRVAIYDQGIIDILQTVGFEEMGITHLATPFGLFDTTDASPEWFNDPGAAVEVVRGGNLFYHDWRALDYVQPELIITGARSFGMNREGARHGSPASELFREASELRYSHTPFIRMSINAIDSSLLPDMKNNVGMLAQIFPAAADALRAELAEVEAEMAAIAEATKESGAKALFIQMTGVESMGIFLPDSRFDMIYEEFGFLPVAQRVTEGVSGFEAQAAWVREVDPDVIFLLDRSAGAAANDGYGLAFERFINDPNIQQTTAFNNDDIYSGLPTYEWYTVVGGFSSARQMIYDINRFLDNQ